MYPTVTETPFDVLPDCNVNARTRTIDGTCNNLDRPFIGASKTPLQRLVQENTYEDGECHSFKTKITCQFQQILLQKKLTVETIEIKLDFCKKLM